MCFISCGEQAKLNPLCSKLKTKSPPLPSSGPGWTYCSNKSSHSWRFLALKVASLPSPRIYAFVGVCSATFSTPLQALQDLLPLTGIFILNPDSRLAPTLGGSQTGSRYYEQFDYFTRAHAKGKGPARWAIIRWTSSTSERALRIFSTSGEASSSSRLWQRRHHRFLPASTNRDYTSRT
jgi:hypothetical protein